MTIDFNAIANTIASSFVENGLIEPLLNEMGADLKGNRGYCPVHGGGGRQNFSFIVNGHTLPFAWKCHSNLCHTKHHQSLVGLVCGYLKERGDKSHGFFHAERFLRSYFEANVGKMPARRVTAPAPTPKTTWPRAAARKALTIPCPHFVARGFSPEILERFDIGTSRKTGRTTCFVFDHAGENVVGSVSRTVHPLCATCDSYHKPVSGACPPGEPKWKVQGGFEKSNHLWGYHEAAAHQGDVVYVVESVGNGLRLWESGFAAVAMMGNTLTGRQPQLLERLGKRVVLVPDNDGPGVSGAEESLSLLEVFFPGTKPSILRPPAEFNDIGEMPVDTVKRWAVA